MNNDQIQKFQQRKREIEERTLKSTEESLKLLIETEECGTATAKELLHQGEQLEQIDNQLDEIDNLLTTSQKNINGMKSMFSSLKKSLFGKKSKTEGDPDQVKKAIKESKPKSSLQEKLDIYNGRSQSDTSSTPESKGTDFDSRLNSNMDGMSKSISMLKSLANGLGEEIDNQNKLIEGITTKTDNADLKIKEQNKQIKKML